MSRLNSFFKNTVILVLSKALQPLITFYLIITISKVIGVEGFGAYSTIFKYFPIFQIISGFGLRNLLTRETAQRPETSGQYLAAGTWIAVGSAVLSALLMTGTVNILSDNSVVLTGTMLAAIALLATGISDVYEGIICGHDQVRQVGYALLCENLFRVGLSLWLIYSGYGVIEIVWAFIAGRYLRALWFHVYIARRLQIRRQRVDRVFLRSLLGEARTFALIMVCVTVYWNVDGIMLESMRSAEEVSYYSAAYRFLSLSMILVHSYVTSLFPVISGYFQDSASRFDEACRLSVRALLLAVLPIATGLFLRAGDVLLLLFPAPFAASAPVLQVLIWAVIPYAISQVFAYALVASKRQGIDLRVNVFSMAANIALNMLLIPKFGYIGAAVATLISIHFYLGAQLPYVLGSLINVRFGPTLATALRIAGAGIMMGAFLRFVAAEWHVLVALPVAGLVYVAGLFAFRAIRQTDRDLVLKMIRRPAPLERAAG